MGEQPLISVILAIYNVDPYLAKCLDSILCQDYKNLDIVLVDDGSLDNSGKICDAYAEKDARIRVIHQKNRGVSGARNTGVAQAKGKYITFVDPDDYVCPDFISFMYELLCKYHAQIASCGAINIQPSGRQIIVDTDRSVHVMDKHEALERMCYNDGFYITLGINCLMPNCFRTFISQRESCLRIREPHISWFSKLIRWLHVVNLNIIILHGQNLLQHPFSSGQN